MRSRKRMPYESSPADESVRAQQVPEVAAGLFEE
jgi:hypothetical protein